MDETDILVKALLELAPDIRPSNARAWHRDPALRVIDCVLSLNRAYHRFVVPRLNSFEAAFPSVRSVSDLKNEIEQSYQSADDFVRIALHYRDTKRAQTLAAVTTWLTTVGIKENSEIQNEDLDDEFSRLQSWASAASYDEYRKTPIPGFGLAGFQYLRMLFGANTTKPDLRICQWIERIVGHRVSPSQALRMLERAAKEAGVKLRDADTTIWASLAQDARSGENSGRSTRSCQDIKPLQ